MPQYTFTEFYHASKARDIALGNASGNTNVLTEINAIQIEIDTRASGQNLDAEIINSTVMTMEDNYVGAGTSSHYDAWSDLDSAIKLNPAEESTLRRAQIEMDRVIGYFTRLGYSIKRERDGVANRITWKIKW